MRRVATEGGARYYGVPIGTPITSDMEDDSRARNRGRRAPVGAAVGTDQKRAGSVQTGSSSENPGAVSSTPSAPISSKGFKEPSISGPVPVLVGKAKFGAPEGSSVYKSEKHSGRVYVVTPDGLTHVITSAGELNLTPAESSALTAQVTSMFTEVIDGETEAQETPMTWIRLKSIMDLLEQAEEVGDESQVKKLLKEFREAANSYQPESDPRELRTKIKKATGKK